VSIIASYLVLVELGNSDGRQDADDRNYDQQFYECKTRTFRLHKKPFPLTNF
ncbi:uncharacterized protein METZ01_LOCUS289034, partial [marine metagenome]